MKRREFLTRLTGGAVAAGLAGSAGGLGAAANLAPQPEAGAKLARLAVSTWSLHNYFESTREKEFNLSGRMLELLELPELIADRYKVHHLEACAPHFASTEPSYLKEVKAQLERAHSQVVNMPVDIEEFWTKGGLSDTDSAVRQKAVAGGKKWIDVAAVIGSEAVRCDPGRMNPKGLTPTVESYKELAAYGKSKGVQVIIENHGGVGSEHPEELVKLFEMVGADNFGALPDFANFPDNATAERGLRLLFPHAHVICHAKGLEFDAQGRETKFDFPKCVEISKQAGFKGVYSIEYEGSGDPYVGVQRVLDELVKYL